MSDNILSTQIEQLQQQLTHSQRQTALLLQIAQSSIEPDGVGQLIRGTLETIVRVNDWVIGQFWIVDEQENLARCSQWYFSTAHLPELRAASVDRRLSKGVGLPGRIWSTGLPLLIPDLEKETGFSFTRKVPTLKAGLKSAFGFAIKNGPFTTGVYEFFDTKPIIMDQTDALFYEKLGMYIATLIAQKESDHAARQLEEVNRIVLDHAYDAFIAINEVSLVTQWTSRATALLGWEQDEVLGRPLQEIIVPERYRDAHVKGLFRYLTKREGPVLNKRVSAPALHKSGAEVRVELMIFPIDALDMRRFGAFIVDCSKKECEADIILE
jgi:PAS domain S-box-containing protein